MPASNHSRYRGGEASCVYHRVLMKLGRLACCLVVLLAGCGAASSSTPASSAGTGASSAASNAASQSSLQGLLDGARKEGALTLVWGEGALGGSRDIPKIAAAFN